jgi:hypothetical protein
MIALHDSDDEREKCVRKSVHRGGEEKSERRSEEKNLNLFAIECVLLIFFAWWKREEEVKMKIKR